MTTLIQKMVGDHDDQQNDSKGRWTGGAEHDSSLSAAEHGTDPRVGRQRARVLGAIVLTEAAGTRS